MAHTDKDQPWRLLPVALFPREEPEVARTGKYGHHKKTARLMRSMHRCGGAFCKCLLTENSRGREKNVWKKEVLLELASID